MPNFSHNEDNNKPSARLPEKQKVSLGNKTRAYREAGEGPPIFFLHGMNGESGSWLYQLLGLSDTHRVIAWDAPGYGESESVGDTVSSLAKAAFELLSAIGAEKPLIVGHSMGGVIAGKMAIENPEAISGLVLSCSHWGWGKPAGEPLMERYKKRINEINRMPIEEFAKLRASRMVPEGTDPSVVAFLTEVSKSITGEALEKVGRANQEADNLAGLAELDIPIFLIYAENDRVIKPDRTETFIDALPKAKTTMLHGVGHAPYIEDSEGYNRNIRSILTELEQLRP